MPRAPRRPRIRSSALARSLLFIACLIVLLWATSSRAMTPEQWREDLAVLATEVPSVHKDPFHTVSQAEWDAAVEALDADLPDLSETEIIVRMAAIVALINDGHTRLTGWFFDEERGFRWYPISMAAFSDGVYIRQAHPDHAELAGARVVGIGGHDIAEAMELVGRCVAADNSYGKIEDTPLYMMMPEVLQAMGVVENVDTPGFELEKDGRRWTVDLPPMSGPKPDLDYGFVAAAEGWVDARAATGETPLWLKHLDRALWYEFLPAEATLYVQQNQIRDQQGLTIEAFYAEVLDFIATHDVNRFVLDLRLNGGGNNYRNRPVVVGLIGAEKINQPGRLFTIIGPTTFSAAQNLVNELEKYTETIFVGEPTGERVNFFGDTRPIELPNSGLIARASWLWWQNHDPRDDRRWTSPHVAAELSFEDYRGNVDPAMEAIRTMEELVTLDAIEVELKTHGADGALALARSMVEDPRNRFRNVESEINEWGYRLLGSGETELAVSAFHINAQLHPESWNVYDSLGEAVRAAGQDGEALKWYRRSLDLRPDSPTGLQAVRELEAEIE